MREVLKRPFVPTRKLNSAFGVSWETTQFIYSNRRRLRLDEAATGNEAAVAASGPGPDFDAGGWIGDESVEHSLSDAEFCFRCGFTDNTRNLLQCRYCFEWIHVQCYNEYHAGSGIQLLSCADDAGEHFCCKSIQVCSRMLEREYRQGHVNNDMGLLPNQPIELLPQSPAPEVIDTGDMCQRNSQSCRQTQLERGAVRLQEIKRSSLTAVASIELLASKGIAVNADAFQRLSSSMAGELERAGVALSQRQMDTLREIGPPQDIRRSALRLMEGCIKQIELCMSFDDVEVVYVFNYIEPVEAAASLYFSRGNVGFVPPLELRCSAGRLPSSSKSTAYATHMDFINKAGHLPLEIGLYSDASQSASGNVEFTPVWLFLAAQEPSWRFIQRELAHSLIAFLPDVNSLHVRFKMQNRGSPDEARLRLSVNQMKSAATELSKQALEVIFKSFAQYEEDGLPITHNQRAYRIHPLLVSYVCDMKERRSILPIRHAGGVWDCSHCYGFPGKDEPTNLGLRSLAADAGIRKSFNQNYVRRRGQTKAEQFNEQYGKLGLLLHDDSPFTRGNQVGNDAIFWTLKGPYECCVIDSLHCKDGIIRYVYDWLEMFVGSDFTSQTQRFGNCHLQTGAFNMHVFEKGILSFHSLPMAVMFGEFKNPELTLGDRSFLFKGVCGMLEVLNLMTDPCPAFVRHLLDRAIKDFESFVRTLLARLQREHGEMRAKMTTKMHELFAHAVEHSMNGGLYDACSAKLLETFMQALKRDFAHTSRRRQDGSAYRGMLEQHFLRQVVDEFGRLDRQEHAHVRTETFEARFSVANHKQGLDFKSLLDYNVTTVGSCLFKIDPEDIRLSKAKHFSDRDGLVFGSSLNFFIHNPSTGRAESNVVHAVVPGVLKGSDGSHFGGFYNAIVFQSFEEPVSSSLAEKSDDDMASCWRDCIRNDCSSRHHDPTFQALCSASRRAEDGFCIPLIFMEDSVLAWLLHLCDDETLVVPRHVSLHQMECHFDLTVVPFSLIRGTCLFRPFENVVIGPCTRHRTCYVTPGRGTYGFNIVQ